MIKLKGVRYALILDANCAFWHLLLDAESSLLMTFDIAGMGRFCFTKLPFGLNCSGDYFQLKLNALYHDEPNQTGIADDMVIVGYKDDGSEPLMPHGIPTHAWTNKGSDLFFFKQCNYLLAMDYYSN